MREDREKCFAVGMQDYITKPVRTAELQAALERARRKDVQSAQTHAFDSV
jgi:CheY-like chemotaxis protein